MTGSAADEFKLLADDTPVMIWRSGPDRNYDWFNRQWLTFTGQNIERAVAEKGPAAFIHPADLEGYKQKVGEALTQRESFSIEYRLQRSDGAFRWILDCGKPYFRAGEFAGFLGSCVDITDHRLAEKNLRAALDERDVLIREVHHRSKNNLQTLMALVRYMRRGADAQGRILLDLLNARLVSMAIVQRCLHATDNMSEVSVRTLLASIVPQLAETELGAVLNLSEAQSDLILAGQHAAYAGFAVAEAIILLTQSGAPTVDVSLKELPEPAIEIEGVVDQSVLGRSQLGLRLVRQYARGAGAEPELRQMEDRLALVLIFPKQAA